MISTVQLEGAHAIAAMTPSLSKAPFNRGGLILKASGGTIIRARTYIDREYVKGIVLSTEDLDSLVEAGHVIMMPEQASVPAVSGASLWILRRKFPKRNRALDELRFSGILVVPPLDGPDGAKLCVVVDRQAERPELLDRWRDRFMEEAMQDAKQGAWDLVDLNTSAAHAVAPDFDPKILALTILMYEQCGRGVRAAGFMNMVRRSRGDEFVAEVLRNRREFEMRLNASSLATR